MMADIRCEECGDFIPVPVPREGGRFVCSECWGGEIHTQRSAGRKTCRQECADIQYHGDRLHAGER